MEGLQAVPSTRDGKWEFFQQHSTEAGKVKEAEWKKGLQVFLVQNQKKSPLGYTLGRMREKWKSKGGWSESL